MMLVFCLHCGWIEIENPTYVGPTRHGYQLIIADGKAHSVVKNPKQIAKSERKADCLNFGLQLPRPTKEDQSDF